MVELNTVIYEDFDPNDEATKLRFTQMANEISEQSEHDKYKVGSVIFGVDDEGKTFYIPTVNTIPKVLKDAGFSNDHKLAGGHPSMHAEMVGMSLLPKNFKSISFALNVPPCPTCFQGMTEIKNLRKPQYTRSIEGVYFDWGNVEKRPEVMKKWLQSLPILREMNNRDKGRVGLNSVHLGDKRIEYEIAPSGGQAKPDHGQSNRRKKGERTYFELFGILEEMLHQSQYKDYTNEKGAFLIGRDRKGEIVNIGATSRLPQGFYYDQDRHLIGKSIEDKPSYNFMMSATKRALMACFKRGVDLDDGILLSTDVPVADQLINVIGAGVRTIITSPIDLDPNNKNHMALKELRELGVISHMELNGHELYPAITSSSSRRSHQASEQPDFEL